MTPAPANRVEAAWAPLDPAAASLPADIITLVREALDRGPAKPVFIFEDGVVVTRGQFRAAVETFAGYLSSRIGPGDRVLIMLENRAEFMVAWLAVNACGAALVSINTSAGEHDAGHIVRDSAAKLAICGPDHEELIRAVAGSARTEVLVVDGEEPDGLARYAGNSGPLRLADVSADPDAITNVYYTSGTTGPPKGCMVAHDYWIRFVELYLGLYGLDEDDRLLCCLQFFYNDPPWLFLASLRAGAPLVTMRRFSVSRFWPVVVQHRVTRLFALASIPALLLKAEPRPEERQHLVELALHIGIPAQLHAEFVERWGFPWVEGYGLTESGLVVAMPPEHAEAMTGSGSIGLPCPGVEIRLVDDEGREVGLDQPGEVLIKAPGMMRGYLNRPEATAEALSDGWLRSGDLARRDEAGYLYFLGRKKDIVRRAGENVAAAEVENVLRSHPSVLEAAVVAVPDELRGEEVKAYVALVEEASPGVVTPAALVEFCRDRLAKHKVPRYIEYRAEPFPRTPSMRVKKSALVAEVEDPLAGAWDRDRELPDWNRRS
ncbi:MAG TPA: AMP-binding protein [Solirubrobacterales bacterium]|jgi:crotonobetaine/carnitine-CoA ligase